MIGSLFSGIGLLERGLEQAGLGEVAWQAEIDPYCRAVLARHWPGAKRFSDVREVNRDSAIPVPVVCGGFPCQPFSVAGARRGLADDRWLWPEYARIVEELEPGVVIAENVPGLRKLGLRAVLADLARLGFDAEWTCFRASDFGAPHQRNRMWIVATHPDRVVIRDEPGWLSRAIGEAAAAPHSNGLRELQPRGRFGDLRGWARDAGWRDAPPPVRGMDDERAAGLDICSYDDRRREGEAGDEVEAPDAWRIAALGNAVVEHCAFVVGCAVADALTRGALYPGTKDFPRKDLCMWRRKAKE